MVSVKVGVKKKDLVWLIPLVAVLVVGVVDEIGISKKVARLKPLAVVKG